RLEFYVVQNSGKKFPYALRTEKHLTNNRQKKIYFNYKFLLHQYYPTNFDTPKFFKKQLDQTIDIVIIKGLLNSFQLYQKEECIKYCKYRISNFAKQIQNYNSTFPKNEEIKNKMEVFFSENINFINSYINLIDHFSLDVLNDVNMKLINPYRIKDFASYFSKFHSDEMLDKLFDLYKNIRIISTKDYDGIILEEIDLEDEEILINEIRKYDNDKIIPFLKRSIIIGKKGEVKRNVINKLLHYMSKQEILVYLSDYFPEKSSLVTALTDKTDNAEFAIKYINEL
ncbi:hypothetical protein ACFLRQ_02885, partial [Bacteroidota bacterium]